jgi:prepilin-type N-terminal cleavage/methylation domain-containing protein
MARSGPSPSGFTLIELLIVICIASVLLLIGMPALLNVAGHYKVTSSARQLEMLGRQARYEAIKLGQPVTIVSDSYRNMFYVFSGTIPNMPPFKFPDGPGDIPAVQRVAVWQVPKGVTVSWFPTTACPSGGYCQSFQFKSDGSGIGPDVIFSSPQQPSSTVHMATPLGLGKLVIQ